jgi:hypothetical protein
VEIYLLQQRCRVAGAGTQTAALSAGGVSSPTSVATYEYDGSSWTAGGKFRKCKRILSRS